jgi:hypothetical protein
LKRAYQKEKGFAYGFEAYMNGLQTDAFAKRREEMRKSMLSKAAPLFAPMDLNGN